MNDKFCFRKILLNWQKCANPAAASEKFSGNVNSTWHQMEEYHVDSELPSVLFHTHLHGPRWSHHPVNYWLDVDPAASRVHADDVGLRNTSTNTQLHKC